MRSLFLLLVLASTAFSYRDSAFWEKVIKDVCPSSKASIRKEFGREFNSFCERYDLSNDNRKAHFIGQCAVESACYKVTTEYASGNAYNGRKDLGNTRPGDGPRFRGRGLIQLTGRANYKKMGKKLRQNFEGNPTMVANFPWALEVSGMYWKERNIINSKRKRMRGESLNTLADKNNYRLVTFNINGGFNHASQREKYTKKAQAMLAANPNQHGGKTPFKLPKKALVPGAKEVSAQAPAALPTGFAPSALGRIFAPVKRFFGAEDKRMKNGWKQLSGGWFFKDNWWYRVDPKTNQGWFWSSSSGWLKAK